MAIGRIDDLNRAPLGDGDADRSSPLRAKISAAIQNATRALPTQGPITAFVHHNPLHALESLPFAEAVVKGSQIYGYEPYWPLQRYQEELRRGRIHKDDVRKILMDELGEQSEHPIAHLGTKYTLSLGILQNPILVIPPGEATWVTEDSEWLSQFAADVPQSHRRRMVDQTREWMMRDPEALAWGEKWNLFTDSGFKITDLERLSDPQWQRLTLRILWKICEAGILKGRREQQVSHESHRKVRKTVLGTSTEKVDHLVNDILIRFCSNFIDQGFASVPIPGLRQDFLDSFLSLYTTRWTPKPIWLRGFPTRAAAHIGLSPLQSIETSIEELGIETIDIDSFLFETVLALRGFAGMIWQLEARAPWTPRTLAAGTLEGFIAVRLLLDTHAARYLQQESSEEKNQSNNTAPWTEKNATQQRKEITSRTLHLFQIVQSQRWSLPSLLSLNTNDWQHLLGEIDQFDTLQQRRILHEAYEWGYVRKAMDAFAVHAVRINQRANRKPPTVPAYQVVCCIDDREESLRRHLEEIDPQCETYGAAGFFGVAMYYQGASQAHFRPLAPAILTPEHYVKEEPVFSAVDLNRLRSGRRRFIGRLTRSVHSGSRTLMGGALMGLFGSLATFPLVTRVLAPRVTARLRESLGTFVRPPATELRLQRLTAEPGIEESSQGYTIAEMTDIVIRVLEDTGLINRLAPLVIMLGHGSSSLNNPHESAYSCGACSGGRGGPNARAFASMANDPRVRQLVLEQGFYIPPETWFVGAYHNTCNDRIEYFDLDRVPLLHRSLFRRVECRLSEARARNAHERARRFQTVPLESTLEETVALVEQRSEDLSEARPEYNHATNALCLVGNRSWSRGLFLDRRAFLTSYDPALDDDDHSILTRILQAVIPVCTGISLEYLFSTIDPEGYGCGSKLPHNIVGLLGVMTGAASDLRPGLSSQMIEIHEPMRILFIVESTPEALERILEKNPGLARLVRGRWIRLAAISPVNPTLFLHNGNTFLEYFPETNSLDEVASSLQWYRNWRKHLGFAAIVSDEAAQTEQQDKRKSHKS